MDKLNKCLIDCVQCHSLIHYSLCSKCYIVHYIGVIKEWFWMQLFWRKLNDDWLWLHVFICLVNGVPPFWCLSCQLPDLITRWPENTSVGNLWTFLFFFFINKISCLKCLEGLAVVDRVVQNSSGSIGCKIKSGLQVFFWEKKFAMVQGQWPAP